MRRLSWTFGTVLILALLLVASAPRPHMIRAQEGDPTAGQCAAMLAGAPEAAANDCGPLAPGEVCLGSPAATALAGGSASQEFAAPGDKLALSALDSLATEAADPSAGTWGLIALALPAGLPEGEAVSGALFGAATLAQPAPAAAGRPTLTVTNPAAAEANLRGGAGTSFPVVGVLPGGASATADGRNEQSDWVRIQIEDGVAWVFARLVSWEGDLSALDVLLPTDMTSPFKAGEPFAALTLTTGAETEAGPTCAGAPSGLLLQRSGEAEAELSVNGATLRFSDATLLLRATAGAGLDVIALDGEATVTARGVPVTLRGGQATRVPLGGEDGLAAAGQPSRAQPFALSEAANAPLALLPGALECRVSATASNVTLRVGPGETRGALASMRPGETYAVLGWANDPDGAPWYELDTGAQTSWVKQDAIERFGACDAVAQVEAPPMVFAAPAAPPPGEPGAVEAVDDFSPATNTVWQMYPGSDQMSGQCSGAPAINFCDHLAAIAPASGGVMWKGMEASGYYLQRIQPNVYAYAGPNVLGTGTINMTLRFTAENTVTMTQTLTLRSEPGCTHTYYYTGQKNW
ncbi:MAG: SH3 domain-containing protein [Anaerolineae bacterium]|nr:SH3 domain-containing protein [Anaerolineae bacterium]